MPDAAATALPARLLGVDLLQNASSVTATPPIIDSNQPLDVILWWQPRVSIAAQMPFSFRFAPENERFSREFEATLGPEEGDKPWAPGRLYRQQTTLNTPVIGRSISGDVLLTLLMPAHGLEEEKIPLQAMRFHLLPAVLSAQAPLDRLQEELGDDRSLVNVSFRLGPGAVFRHELDLSDGPVDLAVVSAFSYGDALQGVAVAEIELEMKSGETKRAPLVSGVHTARADYDYAPEQHMHERVAIVESIEAAYTDVRGRPFERHKYLGVLPLGTAARDIQAIAVSNDSDVVLDVYALVFVPADPAGSLP